MRKIMVMVCAAFVLLIGCENPAGGGSGESGQKLFTVQQYQNAGANVAARKWSQDYDCSNFSTQFYQNCYKAGLPCRIRLGIQNGLIGETGNHAWNSVKINGQWVDWEPQLNEVYANKHQQTSTVTDPVAAQFGITEEMITRIMYELVGRKVPKSVIDTHEIDTHLLKNSPFNAYFGGALLTNQGDLQTMAVHAPNNGDGIISLSGDGHIIFAYRLNNECRALLNLDNDDPQEGRSVTQAVPDRVFDSNTTFIKLDISF